jgi:5-methylcytosine-specific restriction endonuclease McrA
MALLISASTRLGIFTRDTFRCFYCGVIVQPEAVPLATQATVDHILPSCRGGGRDEENLVTACRSCNTRKGIKTLEEYREHLSQLTGQWPYTFAEEV